MCTLKEAYCGVNLMRPWDATEGGTDEQAKSDINPPYSLTQLSLNYVILLAT